MERQTQQHGKGAWARLEAGPPSNHRAMGPPPQFRASSQPNSKRQPGGAAHFQVGPRMTSEDAHAHTLQSRPRGRLLASRRSGHGTHLPESPASASDSPRSPLPSSVPVTRLSAARWRRLRLPRRRGRRGWGCSTTSGCARTRRPTGRSTRRTPSGCAPSGGSSTPRASLPGTALAHRVFESGVVSVGIGEECSAALVSAAWSNTLP
jgi:hypothetical protein